MKCRGFINRSTTKLFAYFNKWKIKNRPFIPIRKKLREKIFFLNISILPIWNPIHHRPLNKPKTKIGSLIINWTEKNPNVVVYVKIRMYPLCLTMMEKSESEQKQNTRNDKSRREKKLFILFHFKRKIRKERKTLFRSCSLSILRNLAKQASYREKSCPHLLIIQQFD